MFKKFLAFFAALSIFAAFAAVEVNKATEAELDGLKGIGPVTTRLIVSERKKADFKSWDDFITRVKGVGEKKRRQVFRGRFDRQRRKLSRRDRHAGQGKCQSRCRKNRQIHS